MLFKFQHLYSTCTAPDCASPFFAGWYVLIDNHLNSDSTAVDSTTEWMTGWARVMTAINADPVSKKFVMYDILNEPDR